MTLAEWLAMRRMSYADFARSIGKSRVDVFRYKKGEVMPRPDVMALIIIATNGAVMPGDFFSSYRPKPTKADAA